MNARNKMTRNTEGPALDEVETPELAAITGGQSTASTPVSNDIPEGFFQGGHHVILNPPGLHSRGVE